MARYQGEHPRRLVASARDSDRGFRLPPEAMVREADEAMYRALLGSVSTKVLRAAKVPVLICPRFDS